MIAEHFIAKNLVVNTYWVFWGFLGFWNVCIYGYIWGKGTKPPIVENGGCRGEVPRMWILIYDQNVLLSFVYDQIFTTKFCRFWPGPHLHVRQVFSDIISLFPIPTLLVQLTIYSYTSRYNKPRTWAPVYLDYVST